MGDPCLPMLFGAQPPNGSKEIRPLDVRGSHQMEPSSAYEPAQTLLAMN
ncbi:hypothetical protein J2R87_005533 [Bradyrhizobium elkanii]|nr:hypothetical protein [Bradyrhizobium elkanii]MCS4106701.1 hypothetical protein [Bradyrhizobium elkanii]MCW2128286.1 hypothetical protein [Bradyrhizobium elkanii]MCW2175027.1 hypothetical protein [Bradyrhizobium elkanii]